MEFKDISPELAAISKNYAGQTPPGWVLRIQEQLQQIIQYLLDLFDRFLHLRIQSGAADTRALSSAMQYFVYVLGAAAFMIIVYLLSKKLLQNKNKKAEETRGASRVDKILNAAGYRNEANSLAATGDFRAACRAVYLSLLQSMHEQGVAEFSPARTNYEYRQRLMSSPPLKEKFMQMAEIVEEQWFGNRSAVESDYAECAQLLDEAVSYLESQATGGGGTKQ